MSLLRFRVRLPIAVALAILMLSAGWAQADAGRPDCYVLAAGVDNYPNANKLRGCLNDARNTAAAFRRQQGVLFGKVVTHTLLDGNATSGRITQKLHRIARQGSAGDYVVIFLSGHGGRTASNRSWYFLSYDYDPNRQAATTLSDRQLLDAAHVMVEQGKKVIVIIDACFSGQFNVTARPYLAKYRNPNGGGLVLMLSSSANQTSAALGQYSAFAKAFADAMTHADLNHDGTITLREVRSYCYERTYELMRLKKMTAKQDSEVHWSASISGNMPLARIQRANTWTGRAEK
jgi:uncharacterized caspase-like protein